MLVFYSGILLKRFLKCYTEKGHKKSCWITGRSNLRFFNKKKFVCVPSFAEGCICGTSYSNEIQSYFPSNICNICYAGQHSFTVKFTFRVSCGGYYHIATI